VGRLIHHEFDKYFKTNPNLKEEFHPRDPLQAIYLVSVLTV